MRLGPAASSVQAPAQPIRRSAQAWPPTADVYRCVATPAGQGAASRCEGPPKSGVLRRPRTPRVRGGGGELCGVPGRLQSVQVPKRGRTRRANRRAEHTSEFIFAQRRFMDLFAWVYLIYDPDLRHNRSDNQISLQAVRRRPSSAARLGVARASCARLGWR